jgi:hypothetical protein
MNRHSLLFALACLVSLSLGGAAATGAPGSRGTAASVRTGRFTVTLAPGADEAGILERVGSEAPGARLVARHRVLSRKGPRTAFVFETDSKHSVTGSRDGVAPGLQAAVAPLGGQVANEVIVRSRGKPVNLPILETDWNRSTVTDQMALALISARDAQTKATGLGQIVAVLDGGFDLEHEFLDGRLAAESYDALDGDADAQDLGDGVNGDA